MRHHTSLRQPDKEHQHMAILNKSDLAGNLSHESGLSNSDAKLAIEKLFELIARHLANGDDVNLAGFGSSASLNAPPAKAATPRPARRFRSPLR
jgi:nucleoid DNA-binding protein